MVRSDGRAFDKIRPVKIQRNYMKHAEGSCLIELGNTKVICTATVEETVPQFLKNSMTGWVTSEYGMLPRSCKTRIQRKESASGRTHEIQRLIGRSLRSIVDMKMLGERTIWIDCDVIQADGGTRTASITGGFIALVDALEKIKSNGLIKHIPIRDYIAATSVGIVKGNALLDLAYDEDSNAEVDMNFVMTGSEQFVEIQGTAEQQPFSKYQLNQLMALAERGIKELVELQRAHIGKLLDIEKK